MKDISIEIYNKLSGVTENTFHNQLPSNVNIGNDIYIVYEANINDSSNLLDETDFQNSVEIIVKILGKNIITLYDTADEIRESILSGSTSYKSAIINNTVPIFYDEDLKCSQYTIVFNVIKENSAVNKGTNLIENPRVKINVQGTEVINQLLTQLVTTYNITYSII